MQLKLGDHVAFTAYCSDEEKLRVSYGVVCGFRTNGVGGEFVEVLALGETRVRQVPLSAARLYAPAGAAK